jgi:hypothetical protein
VAEKLDITTLPRVATIATMASRRESFEAMFPAIHAQVEHTFVYLDGYAEPPPFLAQLDRVTVRHAEREGDLHASSRFLCVRELDRPSVVVCVDDDIAYPHDYVERLAAELQKHGGRAVVGVHGRVFLPPHRSYTRDVMNMHFTDAVAQPSYVHELGGGTCAFVSDIFDIDPRRWRRNDMDDIILAIEAQRRRLLRVAIAREEGWLTAYAENQPDSLWIKTKADQTEQTHLMQVLLGMYGRRAATAAQEAR